MMHVYTAVVPVCQTPPQPDISLTQVSKANANGAETELTQTVDGDSGCFFERWKKQNSRAGHQRGTSLEPVLWLLSNMLMNM